MRILAAALALCLCMAATACSPDRAAPLGAAPAAGEAEDQLLYVGVGASETYGAGADDPLRGSWPQVLFRTALPRSASFVNLGIPGATAADALAQEVPVAVDLKPDLVTVWLNVNDLVAGFEPGAYERNLTKLLRELRRAGRTRVLVANTPPLDNLPAYQACLAGETDPSNPCAFEGVTPRPDELNATVRAYNRAIERAASSTGAEVVDLHARTLEARSAGTDSELISEDGFHPSSQGHRAVAGAFAEVLGQ